MSYFRFFSPWMLRTLHIKLAFTNKIYLQTHVSQRQKKKKKRLSGCVCQYVPFCSVYHFSASLILLQPCHKRCLYSKPIILPKAYINSTNNFGKFLLHHTCVPLLYPRRVDRNLEEKIPVIIRMLVECGVWTVLKKSFYFGKKKGICFLYLNRLYNKTT
jgi:hypothetical protein